MKFIAYTAMFYVLALGLMVFKHAYYESNYINMVFSASSVLVAISLFKFSRMLSAEKQ